jgi:signal peptidase I
VKRGDVVVFRSERADPSLRGKYVQRVVATGGDRIEVVDGILHVNGKRLPDRDGKSPQPAVPVPGRWSPLAYPQVIPAGQVFTLGDNHDNSLDSRYFGPFPVEAITHSADRIIFPLSRAGKIE